VAAVRGPATGSRSSVRGFPVGHLALAVRAVDIVDKESAYELSAELPGMDENNIDVKFSDGTLTIKGEKRDEREEKKKNFYLAERRYGSFQRSFSVPKSVDAGRIEANFKNGVLTVTLPKTPQARQNEKKIPVRQA
jgi:HSP20 family protein